MKTNIKSTQKSNTTTYNKTYHDIWHR